MDAHLLAIMARNNRNLFSIALLNREYWQHYHSSVIASYSRKVVCGAITKYYCFDRLHRPECEGSAIESKNEKVYYHHDRIYRDKGPAAIRKSFIMCKTEEWYRDGVMYKAKNYIDKYSNRTYFDINRAYHHLTKPAVTYICDTIVIIKMWYRHGKVHCEKCPVYITYNSDGSIHKHWPN